MSVVEAERSGGSLMPKKLIDVPDGKGGWKKIEAEEVPGSKQDSEKAAHAMAKAQEEDFFKRVGTCTQAVNDFIKLYANDHGLTQEEVIAAIYLENCNNRHFFPDGAAKFDKICQDVWAWFQENVRKS
jgi:hypothetical protein